MCWFLVQIGKWRKENPNPVWLLPPGFLTLLVPMVFFFLSFSSSSLNWTEYLKVIESNALGSLFNESTGDRWWSGWSQVACCEMHDARLRKLSVVSPKVSLNMMRRQRFWIPCKLGMFVLSAGNIQYPVYLSGPGPCCEVHCVNM